MLPSAARNRALLKYLHRYRRTLQYLASVAVVVLCSGQVLADQHLHDETVPEELCSLCGLADLPQAPAAAGAAVPAQPGSKPVGFRAVASSLLPRPFENSLSRAPPLS